MERCEDNIENWECNSCGIIAFIKLLGKKKDVRE